MVCQKGLKGLESRLCTDSLKMGDAEGRKWTHQKWVMLGRKQGKGQRL